jgi:hypothetical protein
VKKIVKFAATKSSLHTKKAKSTFLRKQSFAQSSFVNDCFKRLITLMLIPNKCHALDRQIDALVYELYELTPEEIALVEAG